MYALTTRGVMAITENGQARLVSDPINNLLPLNATGAALANLNANGYAVVREGANEYRLAVTFAGADGTVPSSVLVYNIKTQAWARENISTTSAVVDTDADFFYQAGGAPPAAFNLTTPTMNVVTRDGRTGTVNDYANYTGSSVATYDADGVYTLNPWTYVRVGDRYDSASGSGTITAIVAQDAFSVTVRASDLIGDGDDVFIYGAIHSAVEWLPEQQGAPGILKRLSEVDVLWRRSPAAASMTVATDFWPGGNSTVGTATGALVGVPGGGAGASVYAAQPENSLGNAHRVSLFVTEPLSAWEMLGIRLKSKVLRKTGR
jgi:hypothetical protein